MDQTLGELSEAQWQGACFHAQCPRFKFRGWQSWERSLPEILVANTGLDKPMASILQV